MALIDPSGLFEGERLCKCSDLAQLHWARLFTASNSYGRLELSYAQLMKTAYSSFKTMPTQEQMSEWIQEYHNNFLLFIYAAPDGNLWGQWLTDKRFLSRYQTAADKRSPAPDPKALEEYRQAYMDSKSSKSLKINNIFKPLQTTSNHSLGIGIGNGVGDGKGEEQKQDLTVSSPEATGGGKEFALTSPEEAPPSLDPKQFFELWDRRRGILPKVEKLTDARRRKVLVRINAGLTLERFAEGIENCLVKPFLHGDSESGWMATFDWLMHNDENLEKAINQPYGLNRRPSNGTIPLGKTEGNLAVLARSLSRGQHQDRAHQDGNAQTRRPDSGPAVPRPVRSVSGSA